MKHFFNTAKKHYSIIFSVFCSVCFSLIIIFSFSGCNLDLDFDVNYMTSLDQTISEDTSTKLIFYAFNPAENSVNRYEGNYTIGSIISSKDFPTNKFSTLKKGYDLSGWVFNSGDGTVVNDKSECVDTYTVGINGAVFYGKWTPRNDTNFTLISYFENPDDDGYSERNSMYANNFNYNNNNNNNNSNSNNIKKGTTDTRAAPDSSMEVDGFIIDRHEGTNIYADGTGVLKIWYKRKISYIEVYSDGKCYFKGSGKYNSKIPYDTYPSKNFYNATLIKYEGLNGNNETGELKSDYGTGLWYFPPKDRKYTYTWTKATSSEGIEVQTPSYTDQNLELKLIFDSEEKTLTGSAKKDYNSYYWFLDGEAVKVLQWDYGKAPDNTAVLLTSTQWNALNDAVHEVMLVVYDSSDSNYYSTTIAFRKTSSGYGE